MDKSAEKIERGHQAILLLQHPLLKEVFDKLDGEYHRRWRAATTVEDREDLFRCVKSVETVLADLATIAETGKLEKLRLDDWATTERVVHVRR